MNIAIIDDDSTMLQLLRLILNKYTAEHNYESVITEYHSGESFLDDFSAGKFDTVFMDIYMNGLSGVETAKQMRAIDNSVVLIFSTSSEEHMPDAFSCHAFDYIVKPANPDRVFRVLDDCLKVMPSKNLQEQQYIEFTENHQVIRVFLKDLVSISVSDHYVCIRTSDKKEFSTKQSFASLTKSITGENFLSVNRGILVNMDYISSISDGECYLTDSSSFAVKVREKASIRQQWLDYCFQKKTENP